MDENGQIKAIVHGHVHTCMPPISASPSCTKHRPNFEQNFPFLEMRKLRTVISLIPEKPTQVDVPASPIIFLRMPQS